MIGTLDWFLLALALGILLWGFERYRSRFIKTDLIIAVSFAFGLGILVFIPNVYDRLGDIFHIQQRYVLLSLIANTVLLVSVLFLLTKIRETRTRLDTLTRKLSVEQAPRADGGEQEIVVIIPAYNEEETISAVLESLPHYIREFRVKPLVVSDGSADATAQNAQVNGSMVVEHHLNQGQGGALKTGFEIAQENNASIVVTMDADGQHPADELNRLVRPIIDDEADYVMGSRHIGQDYSGNSVVRQVGIRTFTWLINVLTKSSITDCTNGYRAIRGSALEDLSLKEERFSAPELIIEARKNGLRLKEIPITIEERQAGETKKPQVGYAIGLTRTILATWIR